MHRFGDCPRRVGLRAHDFRFSARAASGLPLGELAFGLTASAFRHAPLRASARRVGLRAHCFRFSACAASELPSASWFFRLPLRSGPRRVGLRAHCFRFSACTDSEWLLGELVLPPSVSELPFGGLAFGLTASAFRHAPLRSGRWADWPSGSPLPLFGTHRFGVATGRVRSSAFRFGNCPRRVGLRTHDFRFSARAASELPLGEFVLPPSASEIALGGLAFGFTASAFRRAPIRSGCWASWFFRLPFRRLPSAGWFFRWAGWPSGSLLPLFGMRRFGVAAGRVRSSTFRFGDCCSSGWPSGSPLPLFGMRRFGVTLGGLVLPLGGLAFGLTASAFRHAPLRSCRSAAWFFRRASLPSGSRLPLFGTRRSAPPCRRSEGRRSTPTRHLFHFKHLSQHVNLPHRSP